MEIRIKEIQVKGLFGMFDHVIPLNQDSHFTIIYGENGIGKTMIFRILEALFSADFVKLMSLPFREFELIFLNGDWLKLKNVEKFEIKSSIFHEKENIDIIPFLGSNSEDLDAKVLSEPSLNFDFFARFMKWAESQPDLIGDFEIDVFEHAFRRSQLLGKYDFERIKRRFPSFIKELSLNNIHAIPQKLSEFLNELRISLIDTHRLFFEPQFDPIKAKNPNGKDIKNARVHTVVQFSTELAGLIYRKQHDYQKKTEQLENSLRQRLTSQEVKTKLSDKEFRDLSNHVKQRKIELSEVGLIDDSEEENEASDFSKMEDVAKAIIGVNLLDMQTKLTVFDDIYVKLKLFLDIINKRRFSYKSLSIDPEKGFIFTNAIGDQISLEDLSSGEQHELILLYQLLFKVPKGALILIDEPEISLHVAWQKEFINDMSEIIKLRGFDLLVATHSPFIINGQWDLTVSLEGLEKVNV